MVHQALIRAENSRQEFVPNRLALMRKHAQQARGHRLKSRRESRDFMRGPQVVQLAIHEASEKR